MPKAERRRILREHGGTFTAFPPDLDMLASTKGIEVGSGGKVVFASLRYTRSGPVHVAQCGYHTDVRHLIVPHPGNACGYSNTGSRRL
jgi:hypothetical protein